MKGSEARQRQAPLVAPMHVLLQYSPPPVCQKANQSKDTGKAPLHLEVMGLYTVPWTGHPFPAHITWWYPKFLLFPQAAGSAALWGSLMHLPLPLIAASLLPARVLIGNNEVPENDT